jgi:hypothetical protein
MNVDDGLRLDFPSSPRNSNVLVAVYSSECMWLKSMKLRKLFRRAKAERPSNVCPDVLRIENRIQMFCYYNTLAWEILAATLASVIVLATLPFVVTSVPASKILLAISPACALLLLGEVCLVYRLRSFAARWISFPWEDDSTSPRAWIDYVEAGDWKTRRSPRAIGTYAVLIAFIAVAVIIYVWAWFWLGLK